MSSLPPGFRFFPTEEELVGFYLLNKLEGKREGLERVIPVVDIYSRDPWELPSISGELCTGDEPWFFFSPRQERETHGGRPNRLTPSGYWKATGTPSYVFSTTDHHRKIGLKRTMVFYEGKAPTGNKTKWKVNEYKALEEASTSSDAPKVRHELSLCRVYVTSGAQSSFDRRPILVPGTGEMLQIEESSRVISDATFYNNDGASSSYSAEPSHENTSLMEEQGSNINPSPVEETSAELEMMDDLDALWNSFNWD